MQVSSTLVRSCRLRKQVRQWQHVADLTPPSFPEIDYDYDLVRHTCGMGSKKAVQNISKNHNLLFLHTNITPDSPSNPCFWLGFRMFQVGSMMTSHQRGFQGHCQNVQERTNLSFQIITKTRKNTESIFQPSESMMLSRESSPINHATGSMDYWAPKTDGLLRDLTSLLHRKYVCFQHLSLHLILLLILFFTPVTNITWFKTCWFENMSENMNPRTHQKSTHKSLVIQSFRLPLCKPRLQRKRSHIIIMSLFLDFRIEVLSLQSLNISWAVLYTTSMCSEELFEIYGRRTCLPLGFQ